MVSPGSIDLRVPLSIGGHSKNLSKRKTVPAGLACRADQRAKSPFWQRWLTLSIMGSRAAAAG